MKAREAFVVFSECGNLYGVFDNLEAAAELARIMFNGRIEITSLESSASEHIKRLSIARKVKKEFKDFFKTDPVEP